jgi:hypothetical protein
MHSLLRAFGLSTALLLLAVADGNPAPKPPAPVQPKIVSGGLIGHRVCGDFTLPTAIYTFVCDPLPTQAATGWQLTPLYKTDPAGQSVPNKAIVLKVTTPSLTALYVEYQSDTGARFEQTQIPVHSGDPNYVGVHGSVALAATDDGTTKTWTLQFFVKTCTNVAQVNIYNVAGGIRDNPLIVRLLRDPAETMDVPTCPDGPPQQGPSGVLFGTQGTSTENQSMSIPVSCPVLGVCTNCANLHPHSADHWSALQICGGLDAYLKAYGYRNPDGSLTAAGQVCTVREAADRMSCEGP